MGLRSLEKISVNDPRLYMRDLVRADGLTRTAKALGASPEEMIRIYSIAGKHLEESPSMGGVEVGRSSSGDFYDFNKNRIALTSSDPDIFAHEAGHASRLHDAGGGYKALLKGSKFLNSALSLASLPVGGGVAISGLDKSTKKKILNSLAVASVATAVPNLAEEVAASTDALKKSTKKLETLTDLAPGLVSHSFNDLKGGATYGILSAVLGAIGGEDTSAIAAALREDPSQVSPSGRQMTALAPVNSGRTGIVDAYRRSRAHRLNPAAQATASAPVVGSSSTGAPMAAPGVPSPAPVGTGSSATPTSASNLSRALTAIGTLYDVGRSAIPS